MFNSWISFLTWSTGVALATKIQISATKIYNIIQTHKLTKTRHERRIYYVFLALYLVSLLSFIYYNIECNIKNNIEFRKEQKIFMIFDSVLLFILVLSYGYSLLQISKGISKASGLRIQRSVLVLNLIAVLILLLV
jgi:hypothetical protein